MVRLIALTTMLLMATSGCGATKIAGSGHLEFGSAVPHPRPVLPEEVHQNTEDGALAAAKYWLQASDYGIYTGDLAPFRGISLPGCTACEGTGNNIDQTYKRGARNEGENLTLNWESVDLFQPGKVAVVSFEVMLGFAITIEADGHQSGSDIPSTEINQFELHWMGDQWKVAEGAKPKS